MKSTIKLIFLTVALALPVLTMAQDTKQLFAGDIKVVFKKTPKDVISVRLFVRGGAANYSKDKEGVEAMAYELAVTGGTKSMDKMTFSDAAEKIGANFGSNSGLDYSSMGMTCIKPFWEESWKLFTDAVLNPAFDQKEFDLVKEKFVAGAKQSESNPDAYLSQLTMETVFAKRNYAKIPNGTATSLSNITLDDVKNFYKNTVSRKRCFIVVVGNVDEADFLAKVKASMNNLPIGTPATKDAGTAITKTSVKVVDRDMATNYLAGIMNAPAFGTPEGIPMQLAMSIMYDRYFVELRTKRSLSYAPAATYATSALTNPFAQVYISTTKPKDALVAMMQIIDSARTLGFSDKELKDKKQGFLTRNYMKLETSEAQALALGRAEMLGNYQFEDNYTDKVNTASLKDINDVFKKYSNAITWVYLGKQTLVTESDFPQPKKVDVGNGPH